jgi:hypothetical protein
MSKSIIYLTFESRLSSLAPDCDTKSLLPGHGPLISISGVAVVEISEGSSFRLRYIYYMLGQTRRIGPEHHITAIAHLGEYTEHCLIAKSTTSYDQRY